MTKNFWIVLAVIVLGFFGFAIYKNSSDSSGKKSGGTPTSHVKGSASSGVKLVEYGDYQCPGCGAYYPIAKEVFQKYENKIQFQFRNFPLSGIHPNAFAAARAAEAAGMQGKYWEMHDVLFEQNQAYYLQRQQTWVPASDPMPFFVDYANQIGLNIEKFKQDYKSAKVNAAVNADKNRGEELEVNSTPTFFLNGEKLTSDQLTDDNGQPSVEAFSQAIEAAIAESNSDQSQAQQNPAN